MIALAKSKAELQAANMTLVRNGYQSVKMPAPDSNFVRRAIAEIEAGMHG